MKTIIALMLVVIGCGNVEATSGDLDTTKEGAHPDGSVQQGKADAGMASETSPDALGTTEVASPAETGQAMETQPSVDAGMTPETMPVGTGTVNFEVWPDQSFTPLVKNSTMIACAYNHDLWNVNQQRSAGSICRQDLGSTINPAWVVASTKMDFFDLAYFTEAMPFKASLKLPVGGLYALIIFNVVNASDASTYTDFCAHAWWSSPDAGIQNATAELGIPGDGYSTTIHQRMTVQVPDFAPFSKDCDHGAYHP